MYASHFGFHRQPFHSADACRAFFVSESIRTILPQLFHALRSDLGIAVLTGVPGSGKTSLLRHIQQQLSNEGRVIVCSGASLGTSAELISVLLQASCRRAGTEEVSRTMAPVNSAQETRTDVLERIRRTAELWGPVLLLIDDAQLMPLPVLNELRACTEEEWNGRDLVRCLVSAPISFEEQLARSEYAEFGRRIRCHAFLQPLKSGESIRFLQEQIELAGGRLSQVFTTTALELISTASAGIPRCLSLLADESLVVAMESGEKTTTEQSVRVALGRLQHLQYNWNASPDADMAEEPETETYSTSSLSPVNSSGAQEFGKSTPESSRPAASAVPVDRTQTPTRATLAPGVIEFGGPSTKSRPIVQSQSGPDTDMVSSAIEITSDAKDDTGIDEEPAHVEVPTPPDRVAEPVALTNVTTPASSVVEFGGQVQNVSVETTEQISTPIATAATFEVGRRFFAESSSDSISIEDAEDCDFASDVAMFASPPEPVAKDVSAVDQLPCERAIVASDRPSTSGFVDLGDSRLSNCTPIFDRYTWIALGREVPSAADSDFSSTATMQRILEDYEFLGTSQLENLCVSTARAAHATSIDQILVSRIVDSELMDQMRRNALESETGSFVAFEHEQQLDDVCDTPEMPGLKLWHDGQLIFAQSADRESGDGPESDIPCSSASQSANASQVDAGGFFTLPIPIEKIGVDLRSMEIAEDTDLFPIVETLTSLRADVRQFQQTGKTSDRDSSHNEKGDEQRPVVPTSETASESDSLISRAKRRLDDRTTLGEPTVVALQIAPEPRSQRVAAAADSEEAMQAGSTPLSTAKFGRLFTHLWENRRREAGQAENNH